MPDFLSKRARHFGERARRVGVETLGVGEQRGEELRGDDVGDDRERLVNLRGQAHGARGERGLAVWHGHYYAVEVMARLGLPEGAVRVGFVHYNTEAEVDRLLGALEELAE